MSLKTQNAYEHDKLMHFFVGENCPPFISASQTTYNEYKKSLDEINALITYFQDIGVPEEVAYLRRVKMRIKMQMREIKKNIEAKTGEEENRYS